MQELVDSQCNELISSRARIHELTQRTGDFEERASACQRDLAHSHEQLTRSQRDYKDAQVQLEDREQRVATLEKRALDLQNEAAHRAELHSQLEADLARKESQIQQVDLSLDANSQSGSFVDRGDPSDPPG